MWHRGQLRNAFRLFLVAANASDKASQLNVGYFYDNGVGTKRNREEALRWYKRAYRRGDASAANNIGTIWRDEQKPKRALSWFQPAVKLGDDGSNLEIAMHYLREAPCMTYLKSSRILAARESHTETGLYYCCARYYDPNAGRFISEDPAGLTYLRALWSLI